jgi:hypothetical protein
MTAAPPPDLLVTVLPSGGARYRLPRRTDLAPRLLTEPGWRSPPPPAAV